VKVFATNPGNPYLTDHFQIKTYIDTLRTAKIDENK